MICKLAVPLMKNNISGKSFGTMSLVVLEKMLCFCVVTSMDMLETLMVDTIVMATMVLVQEMMMTDNSLTLLRPIIL